MIYLLTSLFYFVFSRKKSVISIALFSLLVFTSLAAYLVGRQPTGDIMTHLCTLYCAVLLYLLFNSFKNYSNISNITFDDISLSRLRTIERIITILGYFALVLYAYILSKTFTELLLGTMTVQEHKNEGGATEFWATLVPHYYITLGNFVAPLGYVFLSLHFYYLINNESWKSVKYLLLSLVIILNGLIALSRSATVQYVLEYFVVFLFVAPLINKKTRKRIIVGGSIVGGFILMALIVITQTRFDDYYTKQSQNKAIIDEMEQPALFSTLDYFAQWEENAPIIMKNYKMGDLSWGMYNSSGLAVQIQKMIQGGEVVNAAREKKYRGELLKEQMSSFHGLIARLIYDFGYIGTVLFILLYAVIIRKTGPYNGDMYFKTVLALPVILPVCVVFWAGNTLSSLALDMAIIYDIVIYYWIKRKPVKFRVLTKQVE